MWLDDLRRTVEQHNGKGATLVVAVSGGADSVALLHGLHRCNEALNLRLVVVHLDHALRPDSGADAAFVGELASRLGWMCLRERIEVAAWATQEGRNVEDAARSLRYTLLDKAAKAVGATAIVVAHTQDDQAETLLMHLLRGAGLEGLTGMAVYGASPVPAATTPLFRPLLGIERATLRAWLTGNGYTWREDSTNADTHRFRSAVRHRVLPLLEEIAPRLRERLARTSALLTADAEILHTLTNHAWLRLATLRDERVCLAQSALLAEPYAIQRRLLRRAYATVQTADRELSAEQVSHALALIATGQIQQQITLPGGIILTLVHDGVWLGAPFKTIQWNTKTLPTSGSVASGVGTFTVRLANPADLPRDWSIVPPTVAFFDLDTLALPLSVRPPRLDDQWAPFGMNGRSVLLREWFSKQKVPHYQRESVPVVVDGTGQILWVVGWRTAHAVRITASTTRVLRIEVTE
jgi:tRNA(Ile)-lysidine synthase